MAARSAPAVYADPAAMSMQHADPAATVASLSHTQYGTVAQQPGFVDWQPDTAFPPGGYGAFPSLTRDYPQYLAETNAQAAAEPGFSPWAARTTNFIPVQTPHAGAAIRREPLYGSPTAELFGVKSLNNPLYRGYTFKRHTGDATAQDRVYQGDVTHPFARRRYGGEASYASHSLNSARIERINYRK